MRIIILMTVLAAIFSMPAHAATLQKGMPVCITEDLYRQMVMAVAERDTQALNWLAENGCGASDKPLHVTVLGMSDDGILEHVRVYRGSNAVEAWAAPLSVDQP